MARISYHIFTRDFLPKDCLPWNLSTLLIVLHMTFYLELFNKTVVRTFPGRTFFNGPADAFES